MDKIVKTVELNAPPAAVWEALTDHRAFGHWFHVALDQPFKAGRNSTGHITFPGHEGVRWLVFIERMDNEKLFSFRWYDTHDGSGEPGHGACEFLTTFELEPAENGTRLTITESGFAALPEPKRTDMRRDITEGWNIQAENLAAYLANSR